MTGDRPGARGPVPGEVARGAALALGAPGEPDPLVDASALGGGCIHPAARVETRSGRTAFLKWSPSPGGTGFGVEARGLRALAHRGGVRIPEVLGVDEGGPDRRGWLVLELVEKGPPSKETPELLGRGLARLHRPYPDTSAEAVPGWDEDGWIATLHQPNPEIAFWPEFWLEARLLPRWRAVRRAFGADVRRSWERMASRMDELLAGWDEDGISLLHGDLWSGNVMTDREGRPVLVDPAVYRGHREVDLAMMELFGGFPEAAFRTYREAWPQLPGYAEIRRDAYQLYFLLVHVELFGSGYVGRTAEAIRRLASE